MERVLQPESDAEREEDSLLVRLVQLEQVVQVDATAATGDDLSAWTGPATRVIDGRGRAVIPGFIDAHGHFPGAGLLAIHADLAPPPIGDVRSLDDVVARLLHPERIRPLGQEE